MNEGVRRIAGTIVAYGFITSGFSVGIVAFFFSMLWLQGGWRRIVQVLQEPGPTSTALYWLILGSGFIGGSLGVVLGTMLVVFLLPKTRLLKKDEVRKFFSKGHL